jgi:GTPase SAR1 family protein
VHSGELRIFLIPGHLTYIGVGKTTLARRYAEGTFLPESNKSTISASLFTRKLNWEGGEVRLQIWDTVGEGELRRGGYRADRN